jgi:hypothetical protein
MIVGLDPALVQDAEILYQEIQSLESHLEQFEKYIEPKLSDLFSNFIVGA